MQCPSQFGIIASLALFLCGCGAAGSRTNATPIPTTAPTAYCPPLASTAQTPPSSGAPVTSSPATDAPIPTFDNNNVIFPGVPQRVLDRLGAILTPQQPGTAKFPEEKAQTIANQAADLNWNRFSPGLPVVLEGHLLATIQYCSDNQTGFDWVFIYHSQTGIEHSCPATLAPDLLCTDTHYAVVGVNADTGRIDDRLERFLGDT